MPMSAVVVGGPGDIVSVTTPASGAATVVVRALGNATDVCDVGCHTSGGHIVSSLVTCGADAVAVARAGVVGSQAAYSGSGCMGMCGLGADGVLVLSGPVILGLPLGPSQVRIGPHTAHEPVLAVRHIEGGGAIALPPR
jgi:hypothetical protein